jgi:hypothetical protein
MHWNSDTEAEVLYEHYVSDHSRKSVQANATACSRNCTTVPNLATTGDTSATLQDTSSCATFLGAEWRNKNATDGLFARLCYSLHMLI